MASVTVMIPSALHATSQRQSAVTVQAENVREVIDALESAYPGMRFHLCYETGELRQFVNVFVASQNIRYLQGLETPVAQGDRVSILPSVAGG